MISYFGGSIYLGSPADCVVSREWWDRLQNTEEMLFWQGQVILSVLGTWGFYAAICCPGWKSSPWSPIDCAVFKERRTQSDLPPNRWDKREQKFVHRDEEYQVCSTPCCKIFPWKPVYSLLQTTLFYFQTQLTSVLVSEINWVRYFLKFPFLLFFWKDLRMISVSLKLLLYAWNITTNICSHTKLLRSYNQ